MNASSRFSLALLTLSWSASAVACASSKGGTTGAGGAATSSGTTSSGATSSSGTGGATAGSSASATSSGATSSSSTSSSGAVDPESVLQRNKHMNRDGLFVEPTLTKAVAATMALDTTFKPTIQGNVYAAPLYMANGPGGKGTFVVVTTSNNVHAVAEADGSSLWTRAIGTPASKTGAGCGNVSPLGILGTPAIDAVARTMYLDAAIGNAATILRHEIHALSMDDGTERAGFPVNASTVTAGGVTFDAISQNERGALLLLGGTVYVPYGGHYGDCNTYFGWVIGVPTANPAGAKGYVTAANKSGIWAAGGPSSDGTNVFVSTGNGSAGNAPGQAESIVRLQAGPVFSGKTTDYFTPSNWQALTGADLDLSGSGPLVVDVPGATPSALVVGLGKNGVAYLLDRNNLGGLGTGNGTTGEGLASAHVASGEISNAPASYTTSKGVYVVFTLNTAGGGVGCPAGQSGNLIAIRIGAASPPTLNVAWCANNQGSGSPIVTTTDGQSNAIVWTAGAEGSKRLHGFDGDTGALVYTGGGAGDVMPNQVRHFNSPIAVNGRIIVAADNALYAFKAP